MDSLSIHPDISIIVKHNSGLNMVVRYSKELVKRPTSFR